MAGCRFGPPLAESVQARLRHMVWHATCLRWGCGRPRRRQIAGRAQLGEGAWARKPPQACSSLCCVGDRTLAVEACASAQEMCDGRRDDRCVIEKCEGGFVDRPPAALSHLHGRRRIPSLTSANPTRAAQSRSARREGRRGGARDSAGRSCPVRGCLIAVWGHAPAPFEYSMVPSMTQGQRSQHWPWRGASQATTRLVQASSASGARQAVRMCKWG